MIVVADASPLHYLILVGHVEVLPQLFERVLVPPAVIYELSRPKTPEPVHRWTTSPPSWLEIKAPTTVLEVLRLGAGEREAISLARETRAEAVLIDDRDAVKEAQRHGLTVLSTLSVLDDAANIGFISDLPETVERLVTATNFRMNRTTEIIIQGMLQRDYERKKTLENGREK
jgi:predicted nucleic acid-binding protein